MGLIGPWVISMGPQIQGPSPRTQGSSRTRPMGRVLGGYPWAVGTHSAVYLRLRLHGYPLVKTLKRNLRYRLLQTRIIIK
jgi:hypothetical protein